MLQTDPDAGSAAQDVPLTSPPREHRPLRFWWVPAALVLSGALGAALVSPASFTRLLLPFFGWQFFHFAKQNLGMVALAASSAGVPSPRAGERRTLLAAAVAGCGGCGIRFPARSWPGACPTSSLVSIPRPSFPGRAPRRGGQADSVHVMPRDTPDPADLGAGLSGQGLIRR